MAHRSKLSPGNDSSVDKDRGVRRRVRGGGAFGMRAALETEGAEEGVRLYGAGKNRSTLLM